MINYNEYIVIEPAIRSGNHALKVHVLPVYDVLGYLAAGMSQKEVLSDFPQLTAQDIIACLAFSADAVKKHFIVNDQRSPMVKQSFKGALHLTIEEYSDFQEHIANGRSK